MHQQDTKTTAGRWSRSAATSDLPTIAFFRASTLLRRNGPVPGILAAHWPGAIMDKSGRRFVVQLSIDRTTKKTNQKTQNYTLDLSSQRGQATAADEPLSVQPRSLVRVLGGAHFARSPAVRHRSAVLDVLPGTRPLHSRSPRAAPSWLLL